MTTVDTLLAILCDPGRNHAQHDEAVRLLGRRGEAALAPLIALLADERLAVRGRAAAALGRCGAKAIKPLRAALADESPVVRGGAASALGLTHKARAVRPLLNALRDDPEAEVRRRAAVALGWLGNDAATEGLTAALEDSAPDVRAAARAALSAIQRKAASGDAPPRQNRP